MLKEKFWYIITEKSEEEKRKELLAFWFSKSLSWAKYLALVRLFVSTIFLDYIVANSSMVIFKLLLFN